MKKRSLIIMLIMAVLAAMCMTACGEKEPPTLESYMNDHPDMQAEIDEQLGADELKGVTVEFSGNDIIYTFDLVNQDGVDEEFAKSDQAKELLDSGLESQADAFKNTANTILEEVRTDGSEIESVRVVVNYTYNGEVITSASYDSDPVE